ncbi:BON domain-containing protein [Legionella hackeliae]|uniref:BON domain-containing protein n=1 Tax=Legionella hackeliae TaxID=449 RepID=A0A0A8UXA9_LEGHA|nr:BON domain-containing protein [Legionella hackeliae]KTD09947.1 osmotically inducible protein Y [Legionella hackeliae]CEK11752.1 protein of unknown function [Legionella hackeliae]STX48522.1 osmotically inducible protein Y [Legionella hackeliae]
MSKVTMKVSNGTIYLSGEVDSDKDFENIVTLAESTAGVTAVNVDNLFVKDNHQSLADLYLTAKIKGTLIRKNILDKNFSAWTIDIKTQNGHVYLTGQADSVINKQAILDTVKSITEVKTIDDNL